MSTTTATRLKIVFVIPWKESPHALLQKSGETLKPTLCCDIEDGQPNRFWNLEEMLKGELGEKTKQNWKKSPRDLKVVQERHSDGDVYGMIEVLPSFMKNVGREVEDGRFVLVRKELLPDLQGRIEKDDFRYLYDVVLK